MNRKTEVFLGLFVTGVTGGVLFGVIGFFVLTLYGAEYGCFPALDLIFGGRGYESCGPAGGIIGAVLGGWFAPLLFARVPTKKTLAMGLIMFITLILVLLGSSWIFIGREAIPLALLILGGLAAVSILPALLAAWMLWRKKRPKQNLVQ